MINTENFKFVDGDFINSSQWGELLLENEGGFRVNYQSIYFDCLDKEVIVDFFYDVSGSIKSEAGDYWTPGSDEACVEDLDITITTVFIDGEEVVLDNETLYKIAKVVEVELK